MVNDVEPLVICFWIFYAVVYKVPIAVFCSLFYWAFCLFEASVLNNENYFLGAYQELPPYAMGVGLKKRKKEKSFQ